MGTFFLGWRRKFGVAMLLLACTFMGGWIRSQSVGEGVAFPPKMKTTATKLSVTINYFYSVNGAVVWERAHEETSDFEGNQDIDLGPPYPKWITFSFLPGFGEAGLNWRWRWCGFGSADSRDPSHSNGEDDWQTFLFVPYWSIVIPLTLVSACLLLTKPRTAKPKEARNAASTSSTAASLP